MTSITAFPEACRANVETITSNVSTDEKTAYAMLLMTATLMDLCPADPQVARIILDDCKGRRVIKKDELETV